MEHPGLRSLLRPNGADLTLVAEALASVAYHAFGRHHLLTAACRHDRLTLHKLVNLIRQLELANDVPLYELGFRCPEQLRRYHASLCRSLPRAQNNGLPAEQLKLAEQAHDHLCQVHTAVNSFYDGLS